MFSELAAPLHLGNASSSPGSDDTDTRALLKLALFGGDVSVSVPGLPIVSALSCAGGGAEVGAMWMRGMHVWHEKRAGPDGPRVVVTYLPRNDSNSGGSGSGFHISPSRGDELFQVSLNLLNGVVSLSYGSGVEGFCELGGVPGVGLVSGVKDGGVEGEEPMVLSSQEACATPPPPPVSRPARVSAFSGRSREKVAFSFEGSF